MWQNKNSFVLIDGNAVMHRAYHGINRGFVPIWNNMPVGMVYGFASTLLSTIEHLRPERLIVAFDTKEPTFRHKLDKEYKAHRTPTPNDFYAQIPLVEELLTAFHIPFLKLPGFEADDICGTLAIQAEKKGMNVRIVSGDLDYSQLLNSKINLVKLNGKIDQSPIYGPAEVKARFGVTPEQMIDFKALVGDSSDNFKGLSGCGPKTAAEWIQQWSTLDNIFNNKENLSIRWRDKLEIEEPYIRQCKILAEIKTDVPVEINWDSIFNISNDTVQQFFEKLNFKSLVGRLLRLNKKIEQGFNIEQKSSSKGVNQNAQLPLF
jgi:DNA polymerase I